MARKVDLTRPGQRVPVSDYESEASELAETFNEMLERLESERRDSTRRVLAAQESERLRIARELHDEVGQTLTAVLLQLGRTAKHAGPELAKELAEAQETARETLEEVRRISLELRPEALDDLGLGSALVALSERFSQSTGLAVTRRLDRDLPALGEEAELVIYRVAQEALTNVARHSGSEAVELALSVDDGAVILQVLDEGRGIHAEDGGGLRGMRERAVLVGAELSVRARSRGRHRGEARGAAGGGAGMTPLKTRILLADDHAVVRRGLRLVLESEPDLEVVAEVGDGAEAVERALSDDVDLAILDVTMPRMTGLHAAAELGRRRPELRVLILSMHDNEQYLFEALKAGASGYVLKSVADRDLVEACRATMRGEPFLYPGAITALIRDHLERARAGDTVGDPLSPRETEIVKLIAEGHTSREIAETLVLSEKTVERHRTNILEKLGMRDRVELTRYAIRRGLIEP